MRVAISQRWRFRAGPRADMPYIQVPDYFKRPSQEEDTSHLCPGGAQNKGALTDYCTPFQFNRVLLSLCIGVWSFEFASTNIGRFLSLTALPTDLFTS